MPSIDLKDVLKTISQSKIQKGSFLKKIAQVRPETEAFKEKKEEKENFSKEVPVFIRINKEEEIEKEAALFIDEEEDEEDRLPEGEPSEVLKSLWEEVQSGRLDSIELQSKLYKMVLDPVYAYELIKNYYNEFLADYPELMDEADETLSGSNKESLSPGFMNRRDGSIWSFILDGKINADDFIAEHPEIVARFLKNPGIAVEILQNKG
jgi:hypothetical protein